MTFRSGFVQKHVLLPLHPRYMCIHVCSTVDRRSQCRAEEQPGNHKPGLLHLPQSVRLLQSGRHQRQERLPGDGGTAKFLLFYWQQVNTLSAVCVCACVCVYGSHSSVHVAHTLLSTFLSLSLSLPTSPLLFSFPTISSCFCLPVRPQQE